MGTAAWGRYPIRMTMPTFADAEAAIAARDYRAALSILEALDVVGEDACYRRDIQAAVCADRLGLFPLCEEYATRAHFYGDDMADPFALMARAQRLGSSGGCNGSW